MKRKLASRLLAGATVVVLAAESLGGVHVKAADVSGALSVGHPEFLYTETLKDVYDLDSLGVSYGSKDLMMSIYEKDLADGGDSFYMDRILARYGECSNSAEMGGNADANIFMTRGRALYMSGSDPFVIGFGGATAYCQYMGGNMYDITLEKNGSRIWQTEDKDSRVNYPSNWVSSYSFEGTGITADVTKFISEQNVAVTTMTLKNSGTEAETVTLKATSEFVDTAAKTTVGGTEVDELVGYKKSPNNLTDIKTRLTGVGFTVSGNNNISREVTIPADGSAEVRVVMAFTTEEIPESAEDYIRFMEYEDNLSAVRAQKKEYNLYWAENIPYVDVPNKAIQKAIDYRWWTERYNVLDANIPGYDYQYPVTIEGVTGYNNAIILTQGMHLQDTKWLRTPNLSYGQIFSAGNSSQSSAFIDNPGNRNNWNNHYGQYVADAGLEAYNVHGGGAEIAENFAYYFGHDATGQLTHYGNHDTTDGQDVDLIAHQSVFFTGCDNDTISMSKAAGGGTWTFHGENAYVWAAANAATQLYEMIGDTEKAEEYQTLADSIQEDVLNLLWCEECQKFETYGIEPTKTQHNTDQPNLIKVTESNNYNYFSVGLVPTDEASIEKYKVALQAFSNGDEFPIFPFYTANQLHNDEISGTNNFSNINSTVQARIYESALRTYDTEQEYITDEMLALMVEWMAWNIYPEGGDVRYPNNNEFFNMGDAAYAPGDRDYTNYYRSWIYHNILGNFNYVFFEDMAGIVPRSDAKIELDPIDFSYDHFMVNNVSYHGHDMSVVWNPKQADGSLYYADMPEGYSLYIDGSVAFTLDSLTHVIYDSTTGTLEFPEGEATATNVHTITIETAVETELTDDSVISMMETAGIHGMENLAKGKNVTASYTPTEAREAAWEEKHRADGEDETSQAVNEPVPDPMNVTDGTTVNMPFWGNDQSTNDKDWLIVDLGNETAVDTTTVHFYNDRQEGGYTEPEKFMVEYLDADGEWQVVENQTRTPDAPQANYNIVRFNEVTTSKLRYTFTNKEDHYTAVTEIQVFDEGTERETAAVNTAPSVVVREETEGKGNLNAHLYAIVTDDSMPYDKAMTYKWEVVSAPEGADVLMTTSEKSYTSITGSAPGTYALRFTADDGELATSGEITVQLNALNAAYEMGRDVAPEATPSSDYTASWENINAINNPDFEPTSSYLGESGHGWGNWPVDNGSEHYVEYTWDSYVNIGGSEIYWYCDGGGTFAPSDFDMEYLDANGKWRKVNITTPVENSLELDRYNRIYFDPVVTKGLRLNMTASGSATGIYRFKVYTAEEIAEMDEVHVLTNVGEIPELPSMVNAWNADGTMFPVPVAWEEVTSSMVAATGNVTVNGINTVTGKTTTATIYMRTATADEMTITEVAPVEVTTTQGVVPYLPATVRVQYTNGAYDNQNVAVTWDEITAEDLAEIGTYDFKGTVEGSGIVSALTVNVIAPKEYTPADADNYVYNGDFKVKDVSEWVSNYGSCKFTTDNVVEDPLGENGNTLNVTGRWNQWSAPSYVLDGMLEGGKTYKLSMDVMYTTAEGAAPGESTTFIIGLGTDSDANRKTLMQKSATVNRSTWTTISAEVTLAADVAETLYFEVETEDSGNTGFDFYVDNVSVTEVKTDVDPTPTPTPTTTPTPDPTPTPTPAVWPFEDVADPDSSNPDWYSSPIKGAYEKGIMYGIDSTHFGPELNITRADFAVTLYRIAGKPEVTYTKKFADVADGLYYSKAIIWASNEGIVAGFEDGKYHPDDKISRQDMISMLYRYAGKPEDKATGDYSHFTDADQVYAYAVNPVKWAIAERLVSGNPDGTLAPQKDITRAEIAVILDHFIG